MKVHFKMTNKEKWAQKRNAPYGKYIYRPCGKSYQCIDETTNKKSNLTYKEHTAIED